MSNDSRYDAPKTAVADAEPAIVARPVLVIVALALMWLYFIITVTLMTTPVKFAMGQGKAFGVAYISVLSLIVLSIAFALVMTGRGRNWARYLVAAMFVVILALQGWGASRVVHSPTPAQLFGMLIPPATQVAAFILLFLPGANAWFRSRRT